MSHKAHKVLSQLRLTTHIARTFDLDILTTCSPSNNECSYFQVFYKYTHVLYVQYMSLQYIQLSLFASLALAALLAIRGFYDF